MGSRGGMTRYNDGTKVTVESSRGEISGDPRQARLRAHGVGSRADWRHTPVELGGRMFRFAITTPTLEEWSS